MNLLLIDNYDSFTYNIYSYFSYLGENIIVKRNDEITISDIKDINPSGIIISPGPCTPNESGISLQVIEQCKYRPILGICLGHQAIAQVFGGKIIKAQKIIHGKVSVVKHYNNDDIFFNVPIDFKVVRYNSLVVSRVDFPKDLLITAVDENMEIMALRHEKYPIYGVQFHPESFASEYGYLIFQNFIEIIKKSFNVKYTD